MKEELGDAVLEIILSIILLAIGAGVLALFGVSGDAEWLDGDLVILIGIGAVAVVGGAVGALIFAIKKKRKKKDNTNNAEDNGENNKENDDV